jgi:hypothetical protein
MAAEIALTSPQDADATRGRHFRSRLRGRGAAYVFVIGSAAAVAVGAWLQQPIVMAAGPVALGLAVLLVAFLTADRRAALDFYSAMARDLGLDYHRTASVLPLSPLLGAGEKRTFEHVMHGPLDAGFAGTDVIVALFTYETTSEHHENGKVRLHTQRHEFTVCSVDAAAAMRRFRGVYLRRRQGLLDRLDHDWLANQTLRRVHTESMAFEEAYELSVVEDQDDLRVRQLFSPSLINWLAEHPLRPCLELRAGTLLVYVPGHIDDAGHFTWLYEAARGLTRRLARDLADAESGVPTPV